MHATIKRDMDDMIGKSYSFAIGLHSCNFILIAGNMLIFQQLI